MTPVATNKFDTGSRLVAFLSELMGLDARMSHKNFAQRLGEQIDLSDSFALSESLRGLSRIQFEQLRVVDGSLKEEFLQARAVMVESIIKSFVPDAASMQINLSIPDTETLIKDPAASAPYLKYYAVLQSDLEYKVHKLRLKIRHAVSGVSLEMAQLVALDEALGNTLAVQARKMLTAIPRLLGKRFDYLRKQHLQHIADSESDDDPELWMQPGGWLAQFYQEMQGMLLAELDVRLQPIVGLIEALNEEEDK